MSNKLRPSQLEVLYSEDINGNEFFALHRVGYNYSLTLGELKKYIGIGGSGGGSDIDLTSVPSNIIPDSNGSRILGNTENAWKRLFLTDSIRFINNGIIYGNVDVQGSLTLNGKALAMQSSITNIAGIVDKIDARLGKVESAGGVDLSDYYTKQNVDEILKGYLPYMPIDLKPTAGSSNLVTSGGVLSTIAALDEYGEATYLKKNSNIELGTNAITGNGGANIVDSVGQWVILGSGVAAKGWPTYIDGNEIYLRYGTGHTTRMKISSAGTDIYGGLGVSEGIYSGSHVFSYASGDGLYMSDYSINAHNKGSWTRQLLKFDPSSGKVNLVNGFETNVTSYIGNADNTDYKALLFRRAGKGFRITMTNDRGYIAFGSLNAAKNELTTLNSIVTIGTDGLKYSPNDVNYYDILTSNSLKIGEYAFQDRAENRLASSTNLDNVSYGVWGTLDNTAYTNAPIQNFGLIVSRLNQLCKGQLILPYSNGHLQYRAQFYNNGKIEWSGWKELVFKDDLTTIQSNAANGNTAFGWGNHAEEGYATMTDTINKINEIVAAKAGGIPSYVKGLSGSELSNITLTDRAVPPYDVTSASAVYYVVDKGCFYLVIDPNAIGQAGRTTKAYSVFDGSAFYNSSSTSARKDCLFYNTTTKTVHRIGDSSVLTMLDSGNISSYGFATQQWADNRYLSKTDAIHFGSIATFKNAHALHWMDSSGSGAHSAMSVNASNQLCIGYGTSQASMLTFIDGYELYLRYGTAHTTGVKINSNGVVDVYNSLRVGNTSLGNGTSSIHIYRNSNNVPYIRFSAKNAQGVDYTCGEIGVHNGTGVPVYWNTVNDSTAWKSFITEDNISDYALPKAGGTVDHITTSKLNGYSIIGTSSGLTLSGYFSATRFYEDGTSLAEKYLSKSSDTVTGTLTFNGTSTYHLREASTTPKWYIGKDGYAAFAYVANTSDANMKNLMGDVNLSVNQIANAPARYFTWNNNIQLGRQVGTVAQYWREVLPEVVIENEGVLGLNYASLAVVSAIILARNVETHEQRIARLEKEIATLTDELNSLVGKP